MLSAKASESHAFLQVFAKKQQVFVVEIFESSALPEFKLALSTHGGKVELGSCISGDVIGSEIVNDGWVGIFEDFFECPRCWVQRAFAFKRPDNERLVSGY